MPYFYWWFLVDGTQVLGWLRAGRDDAEDIVDLPWDVRELENGLYLASHPKMPFDLLVSFDDTFVHLAVPLGLETYPLNNEDKVKVYHTLLRLNGGINLMKFSLEGMNDEVYLLADLDLKSLSKDEFNDALTALLFGLLTAVSTLGLEEEFKQSLMERVVAMVYERIRQGKKREELLDFLVSRVGMEKKDAEALLNELTGGTDSNVGYI
ncbi:DNA-binding protein [Thermococcus sp.]|uniref:DNA-binding protein n=1 Tax=Thermococcus sp. TaxID=35749 RepID=UPI00262433E5|nr:DNA-binding protein [Thermococcus sp.]